MYKFIFGFSIRIQLKITIAEIHAENTNQQ